MKQAIDSDKEEDKYDIYDPFADMAALNNEESKTNTKIEITGFEPIRSSSIKQVEN